MKNHSIDLLGQLAATVEELFLKAQFATPSERAPLLVLYRKAYLAYSKTKLLSQEQTLRLAAALK